MKEELFVAKTGPRISEVASFCCHDEGKNIPGLELGELNTQYFCHLIFYGNQGLILSQIE